MTSPPVVARAPIHPHPFGKAVVPFLPVVGSWSVRPTRVVGPLASVLVVACAVAWASTRRPVDLGVYRLGADSVLSGSDRLYAGFGYGILPFTYPPFAACLFVVLVLLPVGATIPLLAAASMGSLHTVLRRSVPHLARSSPLFAVLLAAATLLEPTSATLSFGQVNLVLAALVAIDLLPAGSRRWNGVLIGIAAGVKLTPAVFVVVLLCRRDWPGLARAVGAFAASVVLGFLVLPRSSLDYWSATLTHVQRVGGVAYSGNQSVSGLVWRVVGPGDPVLTLTLSAVIVLLLLAVLTRAGSRGDRLTALVMAAVAGLLVSPISWSHHWVWVVPMLAWIAREVVARRRRRAPERGTSGWVALGAAWCFCLFARVIWWAPAGDDRAYAASPLAQVAMNSYVLLGFVTFAAVAGASWAASGAAGSKTGVREPGTAAASAGAGSTGGSTSR